MSEPKNGASKQSKHSKAERCAAAAEVPILCSMVAMLRGRQLPKCGSCGHTRGGRNDGGKRARKEGRAEQKKNPAVRLVQKIAHHYYFISSHGR